MEATQLATALPQQAYRQQNEICHACKMVKWLYTIVHRVDNALLVAQWLCTIVHMHNALSSGCGTPIPEYQKWPNYIFPMVRFVFSRMVTLV